MKLNNKGFAISSIMYIILVLAVVLISLILVTLSSRKLILDKLREEVVTTIYEAPNVTYRQTIKQLKNEMITYMSNNSLEKESVKIDELNSSIDSDALEKYELSDKYLTAVQNTDSYNVYLGKESTITDTLELPKNTLDIIDYKIYGNSFQQTYTGKNLIPIFGNHQSTMGDLTLTIEDNILTLNGTVSINNQFGLYLENGELKITDGIVGIEKDNSSFMSLESGTYIQSIKYISGSISGTATRYVGLYTYRDGTRIFDTRMKFNSNDSSKKFTLTETTDVQFFVIQFVSKNAPLTFENYKFQLQIEKSSEVTDYEPYVGGVEAPNPNYPQEIQSVGDKTKNLINKEKAEAGYYINSSGNKVSTVSYGLMVTEKIYVKPSTSYTYSGMGNVAETTVGRTGYQYDENDNPITPIASSIGGDVVFTTASNCTYILLQYKKESETPILVEGVQSINYEPYGYNIPIKVSGKNLFNSNLEPGYISSTGENAGTIANIRSTSIISITDNATLSFETDIQTQKISFCYYEDGVFTRRVETSTTNKYLTTDLQGNENGVRFYITSVDAITMTSSDFTNVQLELGTKATNYEPYVEPITTNIYLDEPLRKINDYTDNIDFYSSTVVRKIGESFLHNGTVTATTVRTNTIRGLINIANKKINNTSVSWILSTHDTYHATDYHYFNDEVGISELKNSNFSRITVSLPLTEVTTLEEMLAWLEKNNVKVVYPLEEIKTEQNITLPRIKVNEGASIIEIDTDIKPSNYEFTVIEKILEI